MKIKITKLLFGFFALTNPYLSADSSCNQHSCTVRCEPSSCCSAVCPPRPNSCATCNDDIFTIIKRTNRRFDAKTVRNTATNEEARLELMPQPTNGDEELYCDLRGSFGKGLRQLPSGFVDPEAFEIMVTALDSGKPEDFDKIPMGTCPVERRLVSPQASFSYNILGADSWIFSMPAPPSLTSAQKADEMVEVYWHRLLADVSFLDYDTDPLVPAALADLNQLCDFRGPKINGMVTAQTLFRSNICGVLDGPYISQFLLLPIPISDSEIVQQYTVPLPTNPPMVINDFMTTFDEWFFIQEGHNPTRSTDFDPQARFTRNPRDLGNYVHNDPPQIAYTFALLILTKFGEDALDRNNPYLNNPTQEAFVEFFKPQFAAIVSYTIGAGLKAAWYQKWVVHRTIRPEYYGFLVNQQINNIFDSCLHPDVINSDAVNRIFAFNATLNNPLAGTYFLPQGYPEGSPTHPTYPAGHATIGGAAVTLLKAFFNECFVIPDPKIPDATGENLVDYVGAPLTIGAELNKLAANIAYGRNMAGIHYRSDAEDSLRLGEELAILILEEFSLTYNIGFKGFSLTKFDGTTITVGARREASKIFG